MNNPTSSPDKKPYHHTDLRAGLIRSGLEILRARGAEALTLREVARHAGVSHAAPYRHFKDKEELLAAIAEEGFMRLNEQMDAVLKQISTPVEQLEAGTVAYVRFAIENPDHFKVMFSDLVEIGDAHPSLHAAMLETFRLIDRIFQKGVQEGAMRAGDTRQYALVTYSMVHGLAVLVSENRICPAFGAQNCAPEDIALACARTLFTGLRAA